MLDIEFRRNDRELQAEMQALFEKDDPLALSHAATLGDETITREFLNKFRNEVYIRCTLGAERDISQKLYSYHDNLISYKVPS